MERNFAPLILSQKALQLLEQFADRCGTDMGALGEAGCRLAAFRLARQGCQKHGGVIGEFGDPEHGLRWLAVKTYRNCTI